MMQPEQPLPTDPAGGGRLASGRAGAHRRLLLIGGALVVALAGVAAAVNLATAPLPPVGGLSPGPSTVSSPSPTVTSTPASLAERVAAANVPTRWSALLADPMTACANGSPDPADVAALSAEWRRDGRLEASVDPDCFRDPKSPSQQPDQVDGVPLKARASLNSDSVLTIHKGYTVALNCQIERRHKLSERSLRFSEWPTDARYWFVSVAVSAVNGMPVHGFLPITAIVPREHHVYSLVGALPRCPAGEEG